MNTRLRHTASFVVFLLSVACASAPTGRAPRSVTDAPPLTVRRAETLGATAVPGAPARLAGDPGDVVAGGTRLSGPALAAPATFAVETSSTEEEAAAADQPEGILPLPDYSGDFWTRTHLLGDWKGARTILAEEAGVQIDLQLRQYFQAVPHGGFENGGEYGGRFDTHIELDLMRMGVLPGALLDIRGMTRYGDFIGPQSGQLLPVNTDAVVPETTPLYDDYGLAITSLTYIQFLSEKFAGLVGKIDTFDGDQNEFASGRGATQFMNYNFVFAAPTVFVPASTLGFGFIFLPTKRLIIQSTLLNATNTTSTVGFDDIDGGISATSVMYQYDLGKLPGGVNGNFIYIFDKDLAELDGKLSFQPGEGLAPDTEDNSWMTFFSGWQYVYTEETAAEAARRSADTVVGPIDMRNGQPDLQGIGLFSRVAFADKDTNPWRFNASVGVGGRGILPNRDDDYFGVGYYYTDFDRDRFLGPEDISGAEDGAEVFYTIAITPATKLTLDFQVLDSPLPGSSTSYVFAVRLNTDF